MVPNPLKLHKNRCQSTMSAAQQRWRKDDWENTLPVDLVFISLSKDSTYKRTSQLHDKPVFQPAAAFRRNEE
ncbi:hypothetical protein TNCV_221311 [Trichonephila clavipes]|nr:hypothetical protein TNCV_221311 [Trichonephila clavipes]